MRFGTRKNSYTPHLEKAPVGNSNQNGENKSLSVSYVLRIIKFELLMRTQVKENSYSRLILFDSRGSFKDPLNCNSTEPRPFE